MARCAAREQQVLGTKPHNIHLLDRPQRTSHLTKEQMKVQRQKGLAQGHTGGCRETSSFWMPTCLNCHNQLTFLMTSSLRILVQPARQEGLVKEDTLEQPRTQPQGLALRLSSWSLISVAEAAAWHAGAQGSKGGPATPSAGPGDGAAGTGCRASLRGRGGFLSRRSIPLAAAALLGHSAI